jgi:hypothetical protein
MKTLVHLAKIAFLAIVATAISSCGGDGNGDEPSHPPSISNLAYSPSTAYQVSNGTVAITGSVEFTDAGGDVVSLRLVTSSGEDLTVPTSALSGVTSGTATGTLVVSVDKVGQYTFEVWLVDGRGSVSNRLSGTFEVLPATPTAAISSLRYTPTSALSSPNGTVPLNVTVDVTDPSNWNAYFLRLISAAGVDLTIPISALIDITKGTAAGTFDVPVDKVGMYGFDVWLTDGQGGESNRLSGTFQVIAAADGVYDTWRAWINISAGTIAMSFSSAGTVGGVSATASGTLITSWGLTPTTFESESALKRTASFTGTGIVGGQTITVENTVFSYLDVTYLPLGEQTGTYGVVTGMPTIPQTARVGDTGTLYSMLHYADSTKATLVGTSTTTYAVNAETPSTALVTITTTYKTPAGVVGSSDALTYRITPDGSATLVYEVNTEGTDVITTTYASLW